MGDADAAESKRARAAGLIDSLVDDELARYVESAAWLVRSRALPRSVRRSRPARESRARGRAREWTGSSSSSCSSQILGGVWRQRGKLGQAGELLDGGIETGAAPRQHARAGLEPVGTLDDRAPAGRHRARPRNGGGGRPAQPRRASRPSMPPRQQQCSLPRCSRRGRPEQAVDIASRPLRRGGAGADRGQPAGRLPRAADPLPAGARSSRRRGAFRGARRGVGCVGPPADGCRVGVLGRQRR